MANLSDRLQSLKLERKLLQKDIANAIGVSLRAYRYYEKGDRNPDSEVLIKLADYFNVSVDYLLGRTDDPEIHFIYFERTISEEVLGGGILKSKNEKAND